MIPDDILIEAHHFWCGHLPSKDYFPAEKAGIWFERSDATDAQIFSIFGPFLDAVAANDWPVDQLDRAEAIGLVIMLDQFPRNIFRDDGRAFAYDATARRHARALVESGVERFALIERCFLYLPFEHSEDIADQEFSVALYEALLGDAPAAQADTYRNYLDFAIKHRDLIRRFGRFPHRNAVLGRENTPEEAAFLAEHGRGY
ncbi:Uncharacterized conserved protein, DUF924 family [Kaistia soli DSM 19436]|uniref:Uncharacterized conserved protein, DUF924 family n=1 Tax=Kaistia soli DSM 19436 TaxID=1122133 RepID=A0A1M5NYP4_9HYPH|nr:DUF924 family protein [Kaistia soli]SHG94587.1 Uncharacterized conserved protein, DUF924 family [Kaistia soli DSM 19436]